MATIDNVTGVSGTVGGNVDVFGSSTTSGTKNRVFGTSDWECAVEVKAEGDGPDITKGDTGTLKIQVVSTTHFWTGAGICTGVDVTVDINTGNAVAYTYNLAGTGAMTYTGATGSTVLSAKNTTVDWT